ncbi:MAG: GDSL-type esterase/lipase family protein [Nanoarchaeota archaeon]
MVFSIGSIFSATSWLKNAKVKKYFINIAVLLVSSLLCALVLEVILQVTFPESCKQDDPIYDHSYKPNCYSRFSSFEWDTEVYINAEGLRDDEIVPKEQFDFRILMLGDSMTWGYGVEKEETFSEVLQQNLRAKGINADVINAGATSYSPSLEYLLLKYKGLSYQPDIVVLNLDMSDVQDDYIREKAAEFDQQGNIIKVSGIKEEGYTLLHKIRKKMKLNRFIVDKLNLIDSKWVKKEEAPEVLPLGDPKTDRYAILRDMPVQDEEEHWNRTFHYLSLINELCKENGITFVLTLYPYGVQVSPDEWSEGRHMFGFKPGVVEGDAPQRKVREYAENNIIYVEMLDSFQESETFPLYFPYDGHINRDGHALAATVLEKQLREEGIVEPSGKLGESMNTGYPSMPFKIN